MKMKKYCSATVFAIFLLVCSTGMQAQTDKTQINQLEIMKRFIGTWQTNIGKDSLEVWDCQPYGEGFIINVSRIIEGCETPYYINNVGFDSGDGKLKGYVLWPSGDYMTWIATYNAEKKFKVELVVNFNPEAVWTRYEMVYVGPKERNWINYDLAGEKISEFKFIKVK
jgi:hypothetical protein